MGDMRDLVGEEGAAAAGMFRPPVHAGIEEGAVNDQLAAAVEQVEQARFAPGPVELVRFLHGQPGHPPALGGELITSAGQGLLFYEEILARSLPLLRRDDRGGVHWEMPFRVLHVSLLVSVCSVIPTEFPTRSRTSCRANDWPRRESRDERSCREPVLSSRTPGRNLAVEELRASRWTATFPKLPLQ